MTSRSWGMGNAFVAMGGSEAFFYNPAGLALTSNSKISSSFHAPVDLPELGTAGISLSHNFNAFSLSLGADRFGDQLYNESKVGFAIAKSIERVSLGLKASYLNASVQELSSVSTFLAEFGVNALVHDKVRVAMHAFNLTGAQLYQSQNIPTVLRGGFVFQPSTQVSISAEYENALSVYETVKVGLEYEFREFLTLRSGVNSLLKSSHFGLGLRTSKWEFDIAGTVQASLGYRQHITLSRILNEK